MLILSVERMPAFLAAQRLRSAAGLEPAVKLLTEVKKMGNEQNSPTSSQSAELTGYVINSYSISTEPLSGICKQPALWGDGYGKHGNTSIPLIYFQKPKWIDEESFLQIVKSIQLNLPKGFKVVHT